MAKRYALVTRHPLDGHVELYVRGLHWTRAETVSPGDLALEA